VLGTPNTLARRAVPAPKNGVPDISDLFRGRPFPWGAWLPLPPAWERLPSPTLPIGLDAEELERTLEEVAVLQSDAQRPVLVRHPHQLDNPQVCLEGVAVHGDYGWQVFFLDCAHLSPPCEPLAEGNLSPLSLLYHTLEPFATPAVIFFLAALRRNLVFPRFRDFPARLPCRCRSPSPAGEHMFALACPAPAALGLPCAALGAPWALWGPLRASGDPSARVSLRRPARLPDAPWGASTPRCPPPRGSPLVELGLGAGVGVATP